MRDRLRLRRLVDAVQGLGPAAGEEGGDRLVGEDHQLLDQRVRRRLRLEPGALDPALPVEREVDLGALDSKRAAGEAPPPELGRDAVGQPDVVGELVLLAALEDPLHLPVREPLPAADDGSVEARLAAGGDLDGHAQPVLVRPERAGVVGELVREHRRDEARARRPSCRARTPRGRAACPPGRSTRRRRCAPRSGRRRPRGGPRSRRRSPSRCRDRRERRQVAEVGAALEASARARRAARSPRAAPLRRGAPPARSRSASPGRSRARRALARDPWSPRRDRPASRRRAPCGRRRSACPGTKYGSPMTSLPRLVSSTIRLGGSGAS